MYCMEFYCSSVWSVSYYRKRHKSLARHGLPAVSWTWWVHVEGVTREEKRCVGGSFTFQRLHQFWIICVIYSQFTRSDIKRGLKLV